MAFAQVTIMANQVEAQRLGYLGLSLTHFDDDLEPAIAAGSVVEIGGALYEASAEEPISGLGAIANNNAIYIKLAVAGNLVTPSGTTIAPTWSASKQGWYEGSDRVVAKMTKDGTGAYANKSMLFISRMERAGNLFCRVGASAAILNYESASEVIQYTSTWTKHKEVDVPFTGSVDVYFEYRVNAAIQGRARIYVNGAAIGTEKVANSTTWQSWNEKININTRDLVQLYLSRDTGTTGQGVQARSFRIRSDTDIGNTILRYFGGVVL